MVNSQNINLAICIQVTFISENKLQEKILFRKRRVFSEIHASILNPFQDGNVHAYATTQELKKKLFSLKNENAREEIRLEMTFHLEIQLLKPPFQQIIIIFSGIDSSILTSSQDGNVHTRATKRKKGMQRKKREYKTSNWHTSYLHFGN